VQAAKAAWTDLAAIIADYNSRPDKQTLLGKVLDALGALQAHILTLMKDVHLGSERDQKTVQAALLLIVTTLAYFVAELAPRSGRVFVQSTLARTSPAQFKEQYNRIMSEGGRAELALE